MNSKPGEYAVHVFPYYVIQEYDMVFIIISFQFEEAWKFICRYIDNGMRQYIATFFFKQYKKLELIIAGEKILLKRLINENGLYKS